jgi:hypothetical protein
MLVEESGFSFGRGLGDDVQFAHLKTEHRKLKTYENTPLKKLSAGCVSFSRDLEKELLL